jgi:SAM-dependent methyltransferase
VTTHLSTDLVSVPLLWIVPLAVYLLTFILAFAGRPLVPSGVLARLRVFAALGVMIVIVSRASEPLWFVAGLHLAALFTLGLTCHEVLARARPAVSHLTEFYMWVAAGGALGGVFNALVAPLVFRSVAEYPLALVLACLLAPAWGAASPGPAEAGDTRGAVVHWRRRIAALIREATPALILIATVAAVILGARLFGHEWRRLEVVLLVAFLCFPVFAFRRRPLPFGLALGGLLALPALMSDAERATIHAERSFFGIHRVQIVTTSAGRAHRLVHGTTLHGAQWVAPQRCDEPLSYYHRSGPAGQVFEAFGHAPRARSIGVVGLGTGALSAYAEAGQRWTYFEIDRAVVRIASNTDWFCYLERSPVRPRFVLGDARLSLAADTTRYDLLVLDAYTSDAIPVHLLTREALKQYFDRLTPHGVLALHLSNRHFDLEPVVARLAGDAGLAQRLRVGTRSTPEASARGYETSTWAVLARAEADLAPLAGDRRWRGPKQPATGPLWTDDYSSLVSVLR